MDLPIATPLASITNGAPMKLRCRSINSATLPVFVTGQTFVEDVDTPENRFIFHILENWLELAVLEMLSGQLYLVTVIGVLVGNFVARRR